jgi:hypothetical protein
VTVDRRLSVVDGLILRHNGVAWKLMLSMLPEFHGAHFPTHEPTFRDWKPPSSPIPRIEYFSFVSEIVERCIREAGTDAMRWSALLEHYMNLPPDDRASIVSALTVLVDTGALVLTDSERIWNSLRDIVGRHREYADAEWALPEDALAGLDVLISKLEPSSAYQRHKWLFEDHMPPLEDLARREDRAAYDRLLAERRRDAISEILAEGGLEAVRQLAATSVVSWCVGIALADAAPTIDPSLLDLLSSDGRDLELAGQYFSQRFRQEGWEWLLEILEQHPEIDALRRARLLLATRDFPEAWNVAERLGPAVQDHYWRGFVPYGLGSDFGHLEFVAEQLMTVGRSAAAIDLIGIYIGRGQENEEQLAELIARGLEALLTADEDSELGLLSSHDFETSFATLERHRDALGVDRIALLEWGFLPALGYDPDVPALHEGLAKNPAFFVQVIAAVYRAKGSEDLPAPDNDAGDRASRARNAYRLLSSWGQPPGLSGDHIDTDELHLWLAEAKRLLEESGRLDVGLVHIGHVLASAPPDPNGDWPPQVVRDLLEELHSEEVESGLATEILNRRGVTSRRPEEGGAQEEELSRKYRADADRYADVWPRVAAILRDLARSYEADARRNEDSAERFRRGLS